MLLNIAIDHHSKGRLKEAEDLYTQILTKDPSHFDVIHNLGVLRAQTGQIKEAISFLSKALSLRPHFIDACQNLAQIFMENKQESDAIALLKNCLSHHPRDANIALRIGSFFSKYFLLEEAVDCYLTLLSIDPTHKDGLNNLGLILGDLGQYDKSLFYLEKAIKNYSDFIPARANRSLILLLQGKHEEGWPEFRQANLLTRNKAPHKTPIWKGEALEGKTILVLEEQGIGDSLQFFRYLPLIQKKGGKVALSSRSSLERLFSHSLNSLEIFTPQKPIPPHDFHFFIMDAPLIFGTSPEKIPKEIPYIRPIKQDQKKWEELLFQQIKLKTDNKPKIGLVWAGNPKHRKDRLRSIDPSLFASVTKLDHLSFFSLQKTEGTPSPLPHDLSIHDFSHQFLDFADTAAFVSHLDLVITVDTSIAHLAGAMGKPVWILLPFVPDWRWNLHSTSTPWYPSMRLFRQKTPGDWFSVLEEVKKELLKL